MSEKEILPLDNTAPRFTAEDIVEVRAHYTLGTKSCYLDLHTRDGKVYRRTNTLKGSGVIMGVPGSSFLDRFQENDDWGFRDEEDAELSEQLEELNSSLNTMLHRWGSDHWDE